MKFESHTYATLIKGTFIVVSQYDEDKDIFLDKKFKLKENTVIEIMDEFEAEEISE